MRTGPGQILSSETDCETNVEKDVERDFERDGVKDIGKDVERYVERDVERDGANLQVLSVPNRLLGEGLAAQGAVPDVVADNRTVPLVQSGRLVVLKDVYCISLFTMRMLAMMVVVAMMMMVVQKKA